MGIFSKLYYNTWNIGFIESNVKDVLLSEKQDVHVNWVQHTYKDRFFADPFILSVDENTISVLVEDYPYYDKKGMISLLTVNRKDYTLKDRQEVLKRSFHMSYPFIQRNKDGSVKWVTPEASMSGNLFRYTLDSQTNMLVNPEILVPEPLLDSTIVEYNGKFWMFCTKRGDSSNENLYLFYSDSLEGEWVPHKANPVVVNAASARPAGSVVEINGCLYRVIQNCTNHYGESIRVSKINTLTETTFEETFIKEIKAQKDRFSHGFHTINGMGDLCVVDGLCKEFAPLRRFWFELMNILSKLCEKFKRTF